MPSAPDSIAAFLLADTNVAALVADRITPDKIDQGATLPAVAYWIVSVDEEQSIAGRVGCSATRITFESWAETRVGSSNLARVIKRALMPTDESFPIRGDIEGVTFLDVVITQSSRHYQIPRTEGSDEFIYVTSQDFVFTHLED